MPRLAATLSGPAALAVALAAVHAGAPAASADDADGVVRLRVPAAPYSAVQGANDADGVVIRAQNRGARGRTTAKRVSRKQVSRKQVSPNFSPAPRSAPAPRMAPHSGVRPVAGVRPMPSAPLPGGVRPVSASCPDGSCRQPHSQLHGQPHGAYADCPQCYGQCPPGGCPVCLGVPGLPGLPACGLFGRSGAFAPGGAFNRGGTFVPQHRHEYSYQEPQGLLYPPGSDPRTPGKMGPMSGVQYPYYTTKGPDDFFHDRDGEF